MLLWKKIYLSLPDDDIDFLDYGDIYTSLRKVDVSDAFYVYAIFKDENDSYYLACSEPYFKSGTGQVNEEQYDRGTLMYDVIEYSDNLLSSTPAFPNIDTAYTAMQDYQERENYDYIPTTIVEVELE